MTELKVEMTPDELFRQLGQCHAAIAQLRNHNQALTELVVKLQDRVKQLEAEKASLLNPDNIPVG